MRGRKLLNQTLAFTFLSAMCPLNARAASAGQLVNVTVHSSGIEPNLIGDSAEQEVSVYLPPSYQESPARRYPVVYVFHGFADSYRRWAEGMAKAVDELVEAKSIQEMIVVVPNGRNGYLSSYFTDSPVTGDWERYLSVELVSFVDKTYRTIAQAGSRAILGHSKGGFAAIRMGMRHSDVFEVIYAMSPCCLSLPDAVEAASPAVWEAAGHLQSQDDFREVRRRFETGKGSADDGFLVGAVALAAAFSPNARRLPLFVDLPYTTRGGRIQPNRNTLALWKAASPLNLVTAEREKLLHLKALALDYGFRDEFNDIPRSARAFCLKLAENGIPHVCEAYDGGHEDRLRERIPAVALPFLSRVLKSTQSSQ